MFSLDYPLSLSLYPRAIIFPFWTDAETTFSGSVKYLEILDGPELEQLSSLIRAKQGVNFVGSWALVAEWKDIPAYSNRSKILFIPDNRYTPNIVSAKITKSVHISESVAL